jgi:hypothetical protein
MRDSNILEGHAVPIFGIKALKLYVLPIPGLRFVCAESFSGYSLELETTGIFLCDSSLASHKLRFTSIFSFVSSSCISFCSLLSSFQVHPRELNLSQED